MYIWRWKSNRGKKDENVDFSGIGSRLVESPFLRDTAQSWASTNFLEYEYEYGPLEYEYEYEWEWTR